MTKTLEAICSYRSEKASASLIRTEDLYISTESISSNRGGASRASVPGKGKVARFRDGDTLVSNIRPYFKKIWQADCDGYCSNDVLVFQPAEDCNPDYLYWLLCGDDFFEYVMATSKGTKMPRGDKAAIMSYAIPSNSEMTQLQIASIMNPFRSKIATNAKLNGYLEELANTAFADWLKKHANGKEIASFVSDSDHLSLGELCSKVTDGSHSSPRNDPNGKYPMLSVRDMRRFGFDYASCKMISQIDFDAMAANDCVPKVDDILVAKDGSYFW